MSNFGPDDPAAWLRLCRLPRTTNRTRLQVLRRFGGDAGAVFAAPRKQLHTAFGARPALLDAIGVAAHLDVTADLDWLSGPDRHLLTIDDYRYPALLREIPDPPMVLFVHGCWRALHRSAMAIVGSRNASPSGVLIAEHFAERFCAHRLVVVSGLATGIDAAAHRGAINAQGTTVAVAATGPDRVYPQQHRALARAIAQQGAVVSEFPPGTAPLRRHFPQRNRIVSGLALGTLVVEAAAHSGSLITARLAGEQGREVYAIPGPIQSPLSRGCHRLLRDGAKLVESVQDVLEDLPGAAPTVHTIAMSETDPTLTALQSQLLAAVDYTPVTVDTLVVRSGLTTATVCSMLLDMELQGVVVGAPDGTYTRLR